MGVRIGGASIPGGGRCAGTFLSSQERVHSGLFSLCGHVLVESDHGLADCGGSGTRARICIGLYSRRQLGLRNFTTSF